MDFYERINNLIAQSNLSQGKLEKELNLGNGSISKWKNGKLPKAETIILLSNYFNVSSDYLLTGKEPRFGSETDFIVGYMNNPALKNAMSKLIKLTDSDKTLIFNLINSLYEKVEE